MGWKFVCCNDDAMVAHLFLENQQWEKLENFQSQADEIDDFLFHYYYYFELINKVNCYLDFYLAALTKLGNRCSAAGKHPLEGFHYFEFEGWLWSKSITHITCCSLTLPTSQPTSYRC